MDIKFVFGILSAGLTFVGLVPYFINVHKREIYPHNLSWIGWAFITFVGGLAMISNGFTWAAMIVFANSISCLAVVFYSLYKKVGVWSTTYFDYLFFISGIIGVILWQTFDAPILAIVFAVIADLSFGIPTLIKVYNNPKTENYFAWMFCSLSGLSSLFSLNTFSVTEFLYPLYLFIFDSIILFFLLKNKLKNTYDR
jgi:hypothetical protein